jgi:hypothetical protein
MPRRPGLVQGQHERPLGLGRRIEVASGTGREHASRRPAGRGPDAAARRTRSASSGSGPTAGRSGRGQPGGRAWRIHIRPSWSTDHSMSWGQRPEASMRRPWPRRASMSPGAGAPRGAGPRERPPGAGRRAAPGPPDGLLRDLGGASGPARRRGPGRPVHVGGGPAGNRLGAQARHGGQEHPAAARVHGVPGEQHPGRPGAIIRWHNTAMSSDFRGRPPDPVGQGPGREGAGQDRLEGLDQGLGA